VTGRRRFLLAFLVAFLIHGLTGFWIGSPPVKVQKPTPKKVDRYAKLQTVREKVELPKPESPPKPPEPEKPKPPEPEKPEPPKPKRRKRARPKPKQAAPPPKPAPVPAEPAPLLLSNVNLTGAIAVQRGDVDVFGDPSIAANERNSTNADPRGDDDGAEVGDLKPRAPLKRVPPRVKKKTTGTWPATAPRLGRSVEVVLSLRIGPAGNVAKVRVVKSASEPFDSEAKRVARRLTWYPGTLGGEPVAMYVPWTVEFAPPD
jgi:TonB family protein